MAEYPFNPSIYDRLEQCQEQCPNLAEYFHLIHPYPHELLSIIKAFSEPGWMGKLGKFIFISPYDLNSAIFNEILKASLPKPYKAFQADFNSLDLEDFYPMAKKLQIKALILNLAKVRNFYNLSQLKYLILDTPKYSGNILILGESPQSLSRIYDDINRLELPLSFRNYYPAGIPIPEIIKLSQQEWEIKSKLILDDQLSPACKAELNKLLSILEDLSFAEVRAILT